MRRFHVILGLALFLPGCTLNAGEKPVLAKVNNYQISKEEFEQEFKESRYGRINTPESRKEFLNNLINQKLIIQDAQKKGLDKDSRFLKDIEKYWEQSLLKIALENKAVDMAGPSQVSEKEMRQRYTQMQAEGRADKPYEQMLNQLRTEIGKLKETQMIDNWINNLRKNADIRVNERLLDSNNR